MIDVKFTKSDEEIVAHIIDRLPKEYSEVVTVVEGMQNVNLQELKGKIRAFHKRRFKKDVKDKDEIALYAGGKFKGTFRNCGKQGHKSADCRSKTNTAGNKGGGGGRDIKCFNCNKYAGHVANDCPEEKKIKKSSEQKKRKPACLLEWLKRYALMTHGT